MRPRTSLGYVLLMLLAIGLVAVPALAQPTITGDQAAWADLKAAWVKLQTLPGYRAKITSEGGVNGVMEFEAPNSRHMTMQTSGGPIEMIQVNGKTAIKLGIPGAPSGWQCRDMPQAPVPSVPDLQKVEGTIDVSRGPDTTINGTASHAYVTSTTTSASPTPFKGTWYVGSSTGLPVRFASENGGHSTMLDFYDYGAAIAIALPSC